VRAKREGRRLEVKLRRHDGFAGRCAGTAALKGGGDEAKARFDLGDVAPPDGPAKEVVGVRLSKPLRKSLRPGDEVTVSARTYLAFAERRDLRIR
jgi:hypothetical protein